MRPLLSSILGAGVLAGCLFSSTRMFEFDVIRNAHLQPPLRVQDGQHREAQVELVRARAYEESRGHLEEVDRAGFAATIRNLAGTTGHLSLYLSQEPGLADPASQATRLLVVEIPPGGKELSFEESESSLEHLAALREAVRTGEFQLYVRADTGSDLEVESLVLVVSMTIDP